MSSQEFSFLIVTDIHDNIENTKKLVEEVKDKKFDYVICLGDIVSIPPKQQNLKEMEEKYSPKMKEIFEELKKIGPIIWVPGNHEPYTSFQENSLEIIPQSLNINKKYKKLSNDLYLIGIGGSTPILNGNKYNPDMIPFKSLDFKNIKYEGYPYNVDNTSENYIKSDLIFSKDLQDVIDKVKKEGGENIKMILVSHIGPVYTWTNVLVIDGEVLYLGSKNLGDIFVKEKGFFLNLHGHSHEAKGLISINENQQILNPGDLDNGNYSCLNIKKNANNDWVVSSVTLDVL